VPEGVLGGLFVEKAEKVCNKPINLLDVGTGSGCIGISLKLEHPEFSVTLSDISRPALKIAKYNAKKLGAEVQFRHSDLLKNLPNYIIYDIIVANLPYVSKNWRLAPDLQFEPKKALFADDSGLAIAKQLVRQAPQHLAKNGYLILELDPRQHRQISQFAKKHGFRPFKIQDFILIFQLC
jgi:release factor glutamine methyltransferase